MIIGFGIDIIDISRFSSAIDKHGSKIIEKLFTEQEIKNSQKYQGSRLVSYFANRFATKEALSKAIGCGIGKFIGWRDMEIVNDQLGKPEITINKRITDAVFYVKKISGNIKIHVSVSDEKTYSVASVVLELLS